MSNFTKEAAERNNMNFSLYFTPAENCCKTMRNTLYNQYGKVSGVTENKFLTNSIHIPVYHQCDAYSKLLMEAPFTKYGTGGCITYIELDNNAVHNPDALEKLIDYAMAINIPYLAINFPIDTCNDCGYSSSHIHDGDRYERGNEKDDDAHIHIRLALYGGDGILCSFRH